MDDQKVSPKVSNDVLTIKDVMGCILSYLNNERDIKFLLRTSKDVNKCIKQCYKTNKVLPPIVYIVNNIDKFKAMLTNGIDSIYTVLQLDLGLVHDYLDIFLSSEFATLLNQSHYLREIRFEKSSWANSMTRETSSHVAKLQFLQHTPITRLVFGPTMQFDVSLLQLVETRLTHITFGADFNSPVSSWNLQNTKITHITFGSAFNQDLQWWDLKNTKVTHIVFGDGFNQSVRHWDLKDTRVQSIQFGAKFNHPVEGWDLSETNVKKIIFGAEFNQPVAKWYLQGSVVEEIKFGLLFNQHVSKWNLQDTKVTQIIFGMTFNSSINGWNLKNTNVTCLIFGDHFDMPLDHFNLQDTKVKLIQFGNSFNQPIEHWKLQGSEVTHILFGQHFNGSIQHWNLKDTNLSVLSFGDEFGQPIAHINQLVKDTTIHTLVLGFCMIRPGIERLDLKHTKVEHLYIHQNIRNIVDVEEWKQQYENKITIHLVKHSKPKNLTSFYIQPDVHNVNGYMSIFNHPYIVPSSSSSSSSSWAIVNPNGSPMRFSFRTGTDF